MHNDVFLMNCNYNYDHSFIEDIDECVKNTDGCSQTCTNNNGSFTCSCGAGYTLATDDVDCDGKYSFIIVGEHAYLYHHFQMSMNVVKTLMAVHRPVLTILGLSCVLVTQDLLCHQTI